MPAIATKHDELLRILMNDWIDTERNAKAMPSKIHITAMENALREVLIVAIPEGAEADAVWEYDDRRVLLILRDACLYALTPSSRTLKVSILGRLQGGTYDEERILNAEADLIAVNIRYRHPRIEDLGLRVDARDLAVVEPIRRQLQAWAGEPARGTNVSAPSA
jgi:hypothetical protein